MKNKKLEIFAEHLLDTGKRNNLINFRDSKASTLEIVLPDPDALFAKVESNAAFEVFDPRIDDEDEYLGAGAASLAVQEDDDLDPAYGQAISVPDSGEPMHDQGYPMPDPGDQMHAQGNPASDPADSTQPLHFSREEYIEQYGSRITKKRILLYSAGLNNPITALKNIEKKARTAIEETGVNVAYIAFGFVHWKEAEEAAASGPARLPYRAPLLLVPILFSRESSVKPYYIRMTGDDVVVNPTFDYKLRGEHHMSLPALEEHMTLEDYLASVSRLVKRLGWTVSGECKIGIFSFLKLNMYQDLVDHEDLILRQDHVRVLLGEEPLHAESMGNGVEMVCRDHHKDWTTTGQKKDQTEDYRLDNPLIDLHSVVDADSSQIEAIEMAKAGRSFVLQGPPGTGKSQTITNIIAECLHDGKKVLFVSEKLAALNVVYNKLKKAGLEDFCLELHSYKANKKNFIDDLNRTLHAARSRVSDKARVDLAQKIRSQQQLDAYEHALHEKRSGIDMSLYQMYEAFMAVQSAPDTGYVFPEIEKKGANDLEEARGLLRQYVNFVPYIGYDYRNNCWYGYSGQDSSSGTVQALGQKLKAVHDAAEQIRPLMEEISLTYGISCRSIEDASSCQSLFGLLSSSEYITPYFLKWDTFCSLMAGISRMRSCSVDVLSVKDLILDDYNESVLEIEAARYQERLVTEFGGFISHLFNGEYKAIIGRLRACRKDLKKPSYEEALRITGLVDTYHKKMAAFTEAEAPVRYAMGEGYQGPITDWNSLEEECSRLEEIHQSGFSFGKLPEILSGSSAGSSARSSMGTFAGSAAGSMGNATGSAASSASGTFTGSAADSMGNVTGSAVSSSTGTFSESLSGAAGELSGKTYSEIRAAMTALTAELADQLETLTGQTAGLQASFDPEIVNLYEEPVANLIDRTETCRAQMTSLHHWCQFRDLINTMESHGILWYINEAVSKNLSLNDYEPAFLRAFYLQWVETIINGNPVLYTFSRVNQDQAVETFKEKDRNHFQISKSQIRSELAAMRPSTSLVAAGSAVQVLQREANKKRRQKSIRSLLAEAGDLVQLLKPCFLMSPLSVSTFLSSEDIRFDVVIFDEASQIFPWDAIGSIYRGKQLIVVGDSRQMPPSNFFNALVEADDTDEAADAADFESILDLCAVSFPQIRLKWHYRSRYEELITFSNRNFYDNDLVTFPSAYPDQPGTGVDYHYVDGLFEHKTRVNRKEAEYVADLVFENIMKYPGRSLGVVAFSIAQQALIEKILAKRRQADPAWENFFSQDQPEPFFIKNLETVQGDERDTIIFSVAYAKDHRGVLSHNFGPLNRAGGERRLNVAITRARINVQLVASIHQNDIDLSRSGAEGLRLLREYLGYAEHGGTFMHAEHGGASGSAGQIEADAAAGIDSYSTSGYAGSGKASGSDFYDSMDDHTGWAFEEDVCEYLRQQGYLVDMHIGYSSFRIDLGLKAEENGPYVLAIECDGPTYHASLNARDRDRLRQEVLEKMGWKYYRIWSLDWLRNQEIEKKRLLDAVEKALSAQPENADEDDEDYEDVLEDKRAAFPAYRKVDEYAVWRRHRPSFQETVKEILTIEAPLSEDWLVHRMLFCFDREKMTSAVYRSYEQKMYGCEDLGIIRRDGFLYLEGMKDCVLRIPSYPDQEDQGQADSKQEDLILSNEPVRREFKDIAPEELAAGLLEIIRQNVALDRESLFKVIIHQLGFTRMNDGIHMQLEEALDLIEDLLDMKDAMITLRDKDA